MKKTAALLLFCCCRLILPAQTDSSYIKADTLKVVQLNNDVLSYDTRYFKLNPDARLIDLVNKMPAVLNVNNNWVSRGDNVTEFMVDWITFFYKNDDAMLYNMPARFVGRVDLFEDLSVPGFYQKISDNEYDKAVHFITDSSYANKSFGRAYLGGGMPDGKWNTGFNFDYFKRERHLNVTANSNNVNDQIYSKADLAGVQGSSGIEDHGEGNSVVDAARSFMSNLSLFQLDQSIGINTSNSVGISYFDWPGNLLFYVNYFYNNTNNNTESQLSRDYIDGESQGTDYNELSNSNSNNQNHRLKFRTAYYFDPFTILRLTAGLTTQNTKGTNEVRSNYFNNLSPVLQSSDSSNVERTGVDAWAELLFVKKSEKHHQRSFSIGVTPSINRQDGNSALKAIISDETGQEYSLAFQSDYYRQQTGVSARVAYTDRLFSDYTRFFIDYTPEFSRGRSFKKVDDFITNDPDFFIDDSLMSNDFTADYMKQRVGLGAQHNYGKWEVMAGVYAQYATLHNSDTRDQLDFNNHLFSVFPMVNLLYKVSPNQNLRVHFKGFTKQPSLAQSENLLRMNNPINLKSGNPFLELEWHNQFTARYTIVNDQTSAWMFFALAEYVDNYIGTELINMPIDPGSSTNITMGSPRNFDHYFSSALYASYSKYLQPWKSNVDATVQYGYAYVPGMSNNVDNTLKRNIMALNLRLSSGISENIDFTLNSNTAYSFAHYVTTGQNANVFQQKSYAMVNVIFCKGWFVNTNFTQTYNYYASSSSGENVFLWNASAGYKFLHNKAAEVRLTVHDILNQNKNIDYYVTDIYTENSSSNNIKRYFMLSLVYNL